MQPEHWDSKILIVDDQDTNILVLDRMLRHHGYSQVRGVSDARMVLPMFTEFQPDLVLLDILMPHFDGFAVMKQLRSRTSANNYLPILVLTADATPAVKVRALASGATDFLTKPFDATELFLRVQNLLAARFMQAEIQQHNRALEQRVRERTRELDELHVEIAERLALAAEFRDDQTGGHVRRVGALAELIARELGLPEEQVVLIGRAAPLHDLGKLAIPDRILHKPGPLTDEEKEVMKTHTVAGAKLLSGSRHPLLQTAEEIALTHHECWDGGGYTPGLAGEGIPIAGRIVAVADVYDALTNDRPYRAAWSIEEAINEIRRRSGTKFDPAVVAAFTRLAANRGWAQPDMPAAVSPEPGPESVLADLTDREREVLALVAQGHSNREIAQRLYLTEATVKTHVSRILQKLALTDRTKAAVYYLHRKPVDA